MGAAAGRPAVELLCDGGWAPQTGRWAGALFAVGSCQRCSWRRLVRRLGVLAGPRRGNRLLLELRQDYLAAEELPTARPSIHHRSKEPLQPSLATASSRDPLKIRGWPGAGHTEAPPRLRRCARRSADVLEVIYHVRARVSRVKVRVPLRPRRPARKDRFRLEQLPREG